MSSLCSKIGNNALWIVEVGQLKGQFTSSDMLNETRDNYICRKFGLHCHLWCYSHQVVSGKQHQPTWVSYPISRQAIRDIALSPWFPLGLENRENGKTFSSQGKVREFFQDWRSQGILLKILKKSEKIILEN